MSQLYALNQVGVLNFGPNGVTEISMVELDSNLSDQININQNTESNNEQNESQQIEMLEVNINETTDPRDMIPIQLKINELEGLQVPDDVTIVQTSPKSDLHILNGHHQTSNSQNSVVINPEIQFHNHNSGYLNISQQPTSSTTLLLPQQQFQYQPIQLISLQNPANQLIQYTNAPQPQQHQLLGLQLNPQSFNIFQSAIDSSNLAAFNLNGNSFMKRRFGIDHQASPKFCKLLSYRYKLFCMHVLCSSSGVHACKKNINFVG